MKKLLRMICLTLALCMLAGCGAGGAQPTPSGAFRQTGEAVEPATAQELAACQLAAADYPDYPHAARHGGLHRQPREHGHGRI